MKSPNPSCCRSTKPEHLCEDCRDLLHALNSDEDEFEDDEEELDDEDDDEFDILSNAEDEDEIEDDHLVAPALNWKEIRADEVRERADREQAFNSRSPRRSAPDHEDSENLIPPVIDWKAERAAGR